MSDKRLNNTIFLMFLATENYKRAHVLSNKDFLKLDKEFAILNYISECPDMKRILLNNLEPGNLGIQYYLGRQEIAGNPAY